MRLLANPVLLRAVVVLVCAGCAFMAAVLCMRLLRKNISEESKLSANSASSLEALPLHLYNTVIQQLKQQKHELQVQSQSEQHRAKISDNFSQAVLSNLSCGVLVFGPNGLVKTSNPAAKAILGFASTTGMGAEDIFRRAVVRSSMASSGKAASGSLSQAGTNQAQAVRVADEVSAVLREGSKRREVEADYLTPAGQKRFIGVTVSAVPAADGDLLGVACLINDRTEMEDIRCQQELYGEISAEMALKLRNSLATIAGYALQLADSRDSDLAKQLATDIAHEAAQLEHSIGGFLIHKSAAKAAAPAMTRS